MKTTLATLALLATPLSAQKFGAVDAGAHYIYDYANTTAQSPSLNGFGGHAEITVLPHLRAVVKAGFVENNNIQLQYQLGPSSYTLKQTSITAGARYFPLQPLMRFQPYVEGLLGDLYSTGTLAPSNTTAGAGANQLIYETGAGLLIRFSHRLALMPAEVDYLHTTTSNGNGVTGRLRLSAGLVIWITHGPGD